MCAVYKIFVALNSCSPYQDLKIKKSDLRTERLKLILFFSKTISHSTSVKFAFTFASVKCS